MFITNVAKKINYKLNKLTKHCFCMTHTVRVYVVCFDMCTYAPMHRPHARCIFSRYRKRLTPHGDERQLDSV